MSQTPSLAPDARSYLPLVIKLKPPRYTQPILRLRIFCLLPSSVYHPRLHVTRDKPALLLIRVDIPIVARMYVYRLDSLPFDLKQSVVIHRRIFVGDQHSYLTPSTPTSRAGAGPLGINISETASYGISQLCPMVRDQAIDDIRIVEAPEKNPTRNE